MNRRSVVTCVGDDPDVCDRTTNAVETAWDGPAVPTVRSVSPDRFGRAEADRSRFTDGCGIVTTGAAIADGRVADRLAELPETVPVFAVVEATAVETMRAALRADVDDVVPGLTESGSGTMPEAGSVADPLVERLREAVEPRRVRLGPEDVTRLGEVLLDAGTTLMSTRSDEVETKITWTMENVGEHADVDRIVCYLREGDALEPTYNWCRDARDPASRSLDSFPDSETLSTFENVVRSSATLERAAGNDTETGEGGTGPEWAGSNGDDTDPDATDATASPATVHVPLVADWELLGVVAVETDARRVWRDEEVDLYRTFGDLIAYTIARNERRLELRRRTEQLEQFNAVVSHDLRNPLNVLSGYLEMVEGDVSSNRHEPMEHAVTRMESLIDNLLMLAKHGETIGETESVPATSIAEDAWESVRAPESTLTITGDIGRIEADPNRLRQVFENLFRNAVDHGGPAVSLEIGPRNGPSGVSGLYVSDDGPGIPSNVSDSLFDSGFSTADSSGIGLAIVDRIADAHGWEVDVHNDGGAVFELTFEVEPAAAV